MTGPLATVALQHQRLRRHYDAACRTYDHISLVDLSVALRVWTELKEHLAIEAPHVLTSIAFKTQSPPKAIVRATSGASKVLAYFPDGVITYAGNGEFMAAPEDCPVDVPFTMLSTVQVVENHLRVDRYVFIAPAVDESLHSSLIASSPKRCTFVQWLGADAVRFSFVGTDGRQVTNAFSRVDLVRCVANSMDGAHPAAASQATQKPSDVALEFLMKHRVAGLPLPYFLLLKIAQDLLSVYERRPPAVGR